MCCQMLLTQGSQDNLPGSASPSATQPRANRVQLLVEHCPEASRHHSVSELTKPWYLHREHPGRLRPSHCSNGTRGNVLKLGQRRFRLGVRNDLFAERGYDLRNLFQCK